MKAQSVKVMLAALLGLAVSTVPAAKAGDKSVAAAAAVSINTPVVNLTGTFSELDRNGDGSLTLAEFWKVDRQIGRLRTSEGGIPELSSHVTRVGAFWSYDELTRLFQMLDSNRDGALSPAEFARINEVLVDYTPY